MIDYMVLLIWENKTNKEISSHRGTRKWEHFQMTVATSDPVCAYQVGTTYLIAPLSCGVLRWNAVESEIRCSRWFSELSSEVSAMRFENVLYVYIMYMFIMYMMYYTEYVYIVIHVTYTCMFISCA